jgi:hypothetical protein
LREYVSTDGAILAYPSCDTATAELRARPRVTQQNTGFVILPNIRDALILTIKNFGQTPAYNVATKINVEVLPPFQMLPDNFSYTDKLDPVIVKRHSRTQRRMAWQWTKKPGPNYLTSEAMARFVKARVELTTVYVYGHIDYIDICTIFIIPYLVAGERWISG